MRLPAFHRVAARAGAPLAGLGHYAGRGRAGTVSPALAPAGQASAACLQQYAGTMASRCRDCGPDASCWASCAGLSDAQAQRVVSCYSGLYEP